MGTSQGALATRQAAGRMIVGAEPSFATSASPSKGTLVTYTLFPDTAATTKIERADVLWSEFVENIRRAPFYPSKTKCPLISFCEYGDERSENGSLRHATNVRRIFGVEIDYDGEHLPLAEAATLLQTASIEACLYTSPSHKSEAPRWRVLLPLREPALPEERTTLVGRANRILGGIASRESFTLSQSFYIGRVEGVEYDSAVTQGRCIDDATEIEPLFFAGNGSGGESRRDQTTDAELRAAFDRGEDRYQAMLKLSSRWAARGLAEDDIAAALEGLFRDGSSVNAYGIDLRGRIPGLARSAFRKFGETRSRTGSSVDNAAEATRSFSGLSIRSGSWSGDDVIHVVILESNVVAAIAERIAKKRVVSAFELEALAKAGGRLQKLRGILKDGS